MKKIKILLSAGTAAAAVAGVMALTATPAISDDKPAIEVITHAGAGGGTDVNSRMMMSWIQEGTFSNTSPLLSTPMSSTPTSRKAMPMARSMLAGTE